MDNLLFWSRYQLNRIIPRKSEIKLSDKIKEVNDLFKNIIETKEIAIKTNVPDELFIYADPDLLSCILRNLISNAIKYTPVNGIISILIYDNKKFVKFEITDTGIGLNTKTFENILKSDNSFSIPGILNEKGSGLGLKLCKEFIEMHSGSIWLDSKNSFGSKICFTISRYEKYKSKNIKSSIEENTSLQIV